MRRLPQLAARETQPRLKCNLVACRAFLKLFISNGLRYAKGGPKGKVFPSVPSRFVTQASPISSLGAESMRRLARQLKSRTLNYTATRPLVASSGFSG